MIIVERVSLSNLHRVWRAQQDCPCRAVCVAADSLGARLAQRVGGCAVQMLEPKEMARGHAVAWTVSEQVTEMLLAGPALDPSVERTLLNYFSQDQNILQAYRKCLVQWVEEKIAVYDLALRKAAERGCRSVRILAPDAHTFLLLSCWKNVQRHLPARVVEVINDRPSYVLAALRGNALSFLIGVGLVGKVLVTVLRQGIVWHPPTRRRFAIAVHNFFGMARKPGRAWTADFLVDGTSIKREDLLVILSLKEKDAPHNHEYAEADVACVNPRGLPFPVTCLARSGRRVLRSVWDLIRPTASPHTELRRRVAGSILYSISLEVVLNHYAIGVLLRGEEHSHLHILDTVIMNRFGGQTAWKPYCHGQWGNFTASYLCYNFLPVPGWYPVEAHGKTWSRSMWVEPIGVLQADPAFCADEVVSEKVQRLVGRLKGESLIVSVFPGSYSSDDFLQERYRQFFLAVARLAQQDDRLRFLIKPKASEAQPEYGYFLVEEPVRTILREGVECERIFVMTPQDGWACTSQYLMKVSAVVLASAQRSAMSSAWIEASAMGKPAYAFTPVEFRQTPFAEYLFDRWLFDDADKLVSAVLQALRDDPNAAGDDRLKHWFDPFCDGRASSRLRAGVLELLARTRKA